MRGEEQAGEFLLRFGESVFREVARDARVQVEFDAQVVRKYRLIGYENRAVADADFRDDTLDFGEPGFARDVTALYELRLHDGVSDDDVVARIALRWAEPEDGAVTEVDSQATVGDVSVALESVSPYLLRSAAVAEFGELMRKSYWAQCGNLEDVAALLAQVGRSAGDSPADLNTLLDRAAARFEPYCKQ